MSEANESGESRTYLNCPFDQRERCKELGGRWDPDTRRWYVPEGEDLGPFEQWMGEASTADAAPEREEVADEDRIYLNCPFDEKDDCKKQGGRWDPSKKKWYISKDTDTTPFERWM